MLPAQPLQGLIDGMTCLQAVLSSPDPVGTREIGRRCDLNRTRANRILGTWRHLGLLDQTEQAKYEAGPALHVLAGMGVQASGLLRASLSEAQAWWEQGYSVSVGVRWQDQMSFLIQARAEQPFLQGIGRQRSDTVLRSSAGLAMLAQANDKEIQHWNCAEKWLAHGDGSDFTQLLHAIRQDDYASRSYPQQIRSLGVSLDKSGRAALAISKPKLSKSSLPKLAQQLHKSRLQIQENLTSGSNNPQLDFDSIPA